MVDRHHPGIRAASVALSRAFGVPPVLVRSGGTIPVVSIFEEELGISTILMGFALPDDRMHAPNERFYLPNYVKGIETSIRFLAEIARWQRGAFESGRAPARTYPRPGRRA
jgi:acetylornithine deacetylase/succinyl-diaminopimelate desuccinylase-like protein